MDARPDIRSSRINVNCQPCVKWESLRCSVTNRTVFHGTRFHVNHHVTAPAAGIAAQGMARGAADLRNWRCVEASRGPAGFVCAPSPREPHEADGERDEPQERHRRNDVLRPEARDDARSNGALSPGAGGKRQ